MTELQALERSGQFTLPHCYQQLRHVIARIPPTPRALRVRSTAITRRVISSASAPSKVSRRGPNVPGPVFNDEELTLGEDTSSTQPSSSASRRRTPPLERVAGRRAQEPGTPSASPVRSRGGVREDRQSSPNARTDKPEVLPHGSIRSGKGAGVEQRADMSKGQEAAKQDSLGPTGNSGDESPNAGEEPEENGATELIFKLERRGFGWGEEIFPSLSVEQRPLQTTAKRRDRNRSTMPRPWTGAPLAGLRLYAFRRPTWLASARDFRWRVRVQAGSAELYLRDSCGMPEERIDAVMTAAVAWRVTPAGRPLIDRRRRSRVERNLPEVARYLVEECGLPPGRDGVGRVFMEMPQVMLCKPSCNDRWDRRAVELAAYRWRHGHVNVPEECEESPELGPWVRRQRVARQQGALVEDRLWILAAIGFEFGEEASITAEWEAHFDQLVDWILWKARHPGGEGMEWTGLSWGMEGGPQAREAALWAQLQREFLRRHLLPRNAVRRLDAIKFQWQPEGSSPDDAHWMFHLGRLMYLVERAKKATAAKLQVQLQAERRARVQGRAAHPSAAGASSSLGADDAVVAELEEEAGKHGDELPRSAADLWLQQEWGKRRAGLRSAKLEPGLGFWLARQVRLWRRGGLHPEKAALLRQAGVELGAGSGAVWREGAHLAAFYLTSCRIAKDGETQEAESSGHGLEQATAGATIPHNVLHKPYTDARETAMVATGLSLTSAAEHAAAAPPLVVGPPPPRIGQAYLGNAWGSGFDNRVLGWPVTVAPTYRARAPEGRPPGLRCRVVRWVETQRALWAEGRLPRAHQRYMALLGIVWLLSDKVMRMDDNTWDAYFQRLIIAKLESGKHAAFEPEAGPMRDWLEHQRGLYALGLLSEDRVAALTSVGVSWQPRRTTADDEWDALLSALLQALERGGHEALARPGVLPKTLAARLSAAFEAWRTGRLPAGHALQLQALALTPDHHAPV